MPSPKGGSRKRYPWSRVKAGNKVAEGGEKFLLKNEAVRWARDNQKGFRETLRVIPPNT